MSAALAGLSVAAQALAAGPYWQAKASTLSRLRPSAAPYVQAHLDAAVANGTMAELGLAIQDRESKDGNALTPPGPSGTGDSGHGRGLMQIDDRSYAAWIASHNWQDATTNIQQGHAILSGDGASLTNGGIDVVGDMRPQAAAYNAGAARVRQDMAAGTANPVEPGNAFDAHTAHQNYGHQVGVAATQLHVDAMAIEGQSDHGTGCPGCNLARKLNITSSLSADAVAAPATDPAAAAAPTPDPNAAAAPAAAPAATPPAVGAPAPAPAPAGNTVRLDEGTTTDPSAQGAPPQGQDNGGVLGAIQNLFN